MLFDLLDRVEDDLTLRLLAGRPKVTLDIGLVTALEPVAGGFAVLRLAALDAEDPDTALCRPGLQRGADVFGVIVDANVRRFSAPFD